MLLDAPSNLTHFDFRNCAFRIAKKNESVYELMRRNEADVGATPGHLLYSIFDKNIQYSQPVTTAAYMVAQLLNEPTNEMSDLSTFFIENGRLILFTFLGYLLPFLSVFAYYQNPSRILGPFLAKWPFVNGRQMRALSPKLALIFTFFNLFLFVMLAILCNLIQTNVVVLSTDEFIDSRARLFNSPKVMASCGNLTEKNLGSGESVQSSFFYKLVTRRIRKRTFIDWCSLEGRQKVEAMRKKGGLVSFFLFMYRARNLVIMSDYSATKRRLFVYLNSVIYQEDPAALMVKTNSKLATAVQRR